ncbi:hypothetical protein FPQ18DRAFT_253090 [Pyronema domesticum]|nr:hypothetical protein FPQ18DRAFT_253090 [Pyronema domesticum]
MQQLCPPDLGGPREIHKNYVFVDEHNRHKRLKVMRACEGCRRRKIKCDAATTNTWPCSACTRLKLHCVPPMLQYDRDYTTSTQVMDQGQDDGFNHTNGVVEDMMHPGMMGKSNRPSMAPYHRENGAYRTLSAAEHHPQQHPHTHPHPHGHQHPQAAQIPYNNVPISEPIETPMGSVHFQTPVFHQPVQQVLRQQQQQQADWHADNDYTTALVGNLKIDDDGVAGYISAQSRRLADAPAYEPWSDEAEPNNPSFMPGQHEFAVKIRPNDMPSNEEAAEMFSIFFNHIHPYIPIVNKAAFYRLWETQREQISPLLLETIFACAGRLHDQPQKGLKWIAMATKHLDCFLDVPRLSTVQALLLLLKARESAPQRGYFFRSWMSMVHIIAMARDLHLDSHYELHRSGLGCNESPLECTTRTRVWQACFAYELMICAPQGRTNMQCDPTSIDLNTPLRGAPELDESEVIVHRNFVHFVRLIHNIRRMSDVHAKLKSSPNWRNDPQFLQSGPSLEQWSYDLPAGLHIDVNVDLNQPAPNIDSHLSGNLQVYYHLARIMLHRPALAFGKTFSTGGEWRRHMIVCTHAAKAICRLEEIVFQLYGMLGLQCMSRGVNFSIYSLLSGAMIHLIAATCPDPEFNHDAKEYFTRTMRLLENCIDNSASSEMKGQIETLREAFSVDINRPFVLNPSFPFYNGVAPGMDPHLARFTQAEAVASTMAASQVTYATQPLSPPHSIGDMESKGESPAAVQSLVMLAAGHQGGAATAPLVENWNPSRLFEYFPSLPPQSSTRSSDTATRNWNTAFGVNGSVGSVTAALQPHPMPHHPDDGLAVDLQNAGAHTQSSYVQTNTANPQVQNIQNSFVSPGMWQDSVAAATGFSENGKRMFHFGADDAASAWSGPPPNQRVISAAAVANAQQNRALQAANGAQRGH